MSAKSKGTSREYAVKKRYEKQGYYCTRASMSLGVWDLFCCRSDDGVFIQVKSTQWPRTEEDGEIKEFIKKYMPQGCRFICERYRSKRGWDIRTYDKAS